MLCHTFSSPKSNILCGMSYTVFLLLSLGIYRILHLGCYVLWSICCHLPPTEVCHHHEQSNHTYHCFWDLMCRCIFVNFGLINIDCPLPFCGPNLINLLLWQCSCAKSWSVQISLWLSWLTLSPLLCCCWVPCSWQVSYTYIIITIFRIPSVRTTEIFLLCFSYHSSNTLLWKLHLHLCPPTKEGNVMDVNKFATVLNTIVTQCWILSSTVFEMRKWKVPWEMVSINMWLC